MSPHLGLSGDVEKILRSLERASTEAENGWQDGKYGEFKYKFFDGLTANLEILQESLAQIEEFVQSSKESYPLE